MEQQNRLVSIIIPVYNVEQYLRQCLDSVIGQTYKNLEIIIVEDGSKDECGNICDEYEYKDKRIKVYHTENRGLSAARNLGLDNASGEFISFIDSDDWFEKDAIQSLMEIAIDTGADIVCFRYITEYISKSKHRVDKDESIKLLTKTDSSIMKAYISGKLGTVAWNKIYRRELFLEIRFPEGRLFEDVATTYKLLLKSDKVASIPSELIHYRIRNTSISNSHTLINIADCWWATKRQYEDLTFISVDYASFALEQCVSSAGRMWRWYSGFSKKDKNRASKVMDSMQQFLDDHRNEILMNSNVSLLNKVLYICTMTTNPIVMKILYILNQIYRRALHRNKWY